jgi:hypothetical protein
LVDAQGQRINEGSKAAALIIGLDDLLSQIERSERRAILIGP